MKSIIILTISIFFCFQNVNCFGQVSDNWTSYTENINTGITLILSHPRNTKIVSKENSRCIRDKTGKTSLNWCIWMSDSSEMSISQSIADEKAFFKGQTSIQTDSILIDSVKCFRVNLKSNLATEPIRQIIFFTKLGTTLEIINRSGLNINFDKLCSTLRIIKTEKKPSN